MSPKLGRKDYMTNQALKKLKAEFEKEAESVKFGFEFDKEEIWAFFEPHLATEEHDRKVIEKIIYDFSAYLCGSMTFREQEILHGEVKEYLKGLSKEKE